MANPNISMLITVGIESRTGEIRDNVLNHNALLAYLKKAGKVKYITGGTDIYEEISYAANSNVGSFSGYDQLPTAATDELTSANFGLKQYAVAVAVSGRDRLINSGKEAIIDLVDSKLDVAESSLKNSMATDAYSDGTGNGGKNLTGLDLAVPQDPTTGTYGGINRATSTNTFWRSQLYDPSSTPTSSTIQGYMNILWASCARGADRTKLIIAGSTIWATYMSSLQAIQRFTDPESAKLGFPSIKFMDADVVMDNTTGVTATDMYFLNTDYLRLRPHKDCDFVSLDPEQRYAVNQDATVRMLGWAGNITCAGSRFQGRLKGD